MNDFKAAAIGSLAAVVAVPANAQDVLGIPISLLLACSAGAMFGLGQTPPEKWGKLLSVPEGPRWKHALVMLVRGAGLVFTLVSIAFVMGWVALALPHAPGFTWTKSIPPQAIGGVLSWAGQFWLPRVIEAGNRWLENRGKKP